MEKNMRAQFNPDQIVQLDKDIRGGSEVIVVQQTPGHLYTVVKGEEGGAEWSVMTYRLTPIS